MHHNNRRQVTLQGITRDDIQRILEEATSNASKNRIIFLDTSYLYTFHPDDFEIVSKFNILGRYDLRAVIEWHSCLERWLSDQTVTLANKTIKPIAIARSFDRIVNEGLEAIAAVITTGSAEETETFSFRSIGDGTVAAVLPSDKVLAHEVDRINVFTAKEGGSLSRDGSTIYSIGNHSKSIPTPANGVFTEIGMHSTDSPSTDKMLEHSKFITPVPHVQDADGPGTTTVIYMCSG